LSNGKSLISNLSLLAGPILCFGLIVFFDLDPDNPAVTRTAGVALWMAIWWISEAVPLAVTSLLPVILFPALGIMSGRSVSPIYFNHIIFLFIGGFLVALAMERWNLHRRIALRILLLSGVRLRGILFGSMAATWFLSMWISNTASTMMMVPITLALILKLEESLGKERLSRYPIGVFIGIAYAASIGGIATLVGTPPNLSFARILTITFPDAPEISFASWFAFALPISVVMLVLIWLYLGHIFCPRGEKIEIDRQIFREEYQALGPISFEEMIVLVDFILLVFLWLFRQDIGFGGLTIPGWSRFFENQGFLDDGTVAITMAMILFAIPTRGGRGSRIMDWKTASRLPWNIVLLFGGGFALASGFRESGLSLWMGNQLDAVGSLPTMSVIAIICSMITFLTELTSNTATAEMLLPILAAIGSKIHLNPLFLMIPGTLACSLAFMLPVATPPNAIVFGTGRLKIADMARTGLVINILGIIVVTTAVYLLSTLAFDISFDHFPNWAVLE
jgi:sodium-dependent dicarboxylate transporter 2/3/5